MLFQMYSNAVIVFAKMTEDIQNTESKDKWRKNLKISKQPCVQLFQRLKGSVRIFVS